MAPTQLTQFITAQHSAGSYSTWQPCEFTTAQHTAGLHSTWQPCEFTTAQHTAGSHSTWQPCEFTTAQHTAGSQHMTTMWKITIGELHQRSNKCLWISSPFMDAALYLYMLNMLDNAKRIKLDVRSLFSYYVFWFSWHLTERASEVKTESISWAGSS